MHLVIGKAAITTPTTEYSNAYVEISSDDDVIATAQIRNRQGIDLERVSGPFEVITTGRGGWILHVDTGDVTIVPQEGCGCGGTSVLPRQDVETP